MRIFLDDVYFIKESDYDAFVLSMVRDSTNRKTGEVTKKETPVGYFSRLDFLIKKYAQIKAIKNTSNNATLKEYIDNYQQQVDRIERMLESKC